MHQSHQLAFDLDVESVPPGQVTSRHPPDHLPVRDRGGGGAPDTARSAGGSMMTTNSAESSPKVLGTHRHRLAVVYVRQSTASQVERNTESTDRQYALQERAVGLGWPREAVRIIDADLGAAARARPAVPGSRS